MENIMTELAAELPSFPDIQNALANLGLEMDAAECHGALCGYVCATAEAENPSYWISRVLLGMAAEDSQNDEYSKTSEEYRQLLAMHATTLQQLQDPDFGFRLLLPDDDEPITTRADLLARWCEGFLYGMSAGGVQSAESFDDDVNEVIRDIIEISQLSSEESEDPDMDEAAYTEITEYIRAAVMLIYAELQNKRTSLGTSAHHTLH